MISAGCISQGKPPPKSSGSTFGSGPIDQINLLAGPVALNFDDSPGPDGFVLKIYANSSKSPKPVSIESGKIEVLMFDTTPSLDGSGLGKPKRTWTFTSAELRQFEIRTSIGTGYQLAPLWKEAKPDSSKITVIVRYVPPKGITIASAPSIISVGVR